MRRSPLRFFGKLPTQGDFVRHHAGDPASKALEAWVFASYDALHGLGLRETAMPLSFLLRPGLLRPGSPGQSSPPVVGVLRDSHDRVGRRFPFVCFLSAEAADASEEAACLHHTVDAAQRFLHGSKCFAELGVFADKAIPSPVSLQELVAAADAYTGTPMYGEHAAREATITLPKTFADLATWFGEGPPGQHSYALYTLLAAAKLAGENVGQTPTLLAPIPSPDGCAAWLSIWNALTSPLCSSIQVWSESHMAWSAEPNGTAILPAVLAAKGGEVADSRVWPLWTVRDAAISMAEEALQKNFAIGDLEHMPFLDFCKALQNLSRKQRVDIDD